MNYLKKVTIDFESQNNSFDYYVYKFRMNNSHFAPQDGWMLGVAGPYFQHSKPYDQPSATFSRFHNKSDKIAPDEEARWVHENIFLLFMNRAKHKINPV